MQSSRWLVAVVGLTAVALLAAMYVLPDEVVRRQSVHWERGFPPARLSSPAAQLPSASALAALPRTQQSVELAAWFGRDVAQHTSGWAPPEHQRWADTLAAVLQEGDSPLGEAQIEQLTRCLHEFVTWGCLEGGPGGPEVITTPRGVAHVWRARTERDGVAWMVRVWLQRGPPTAEDTRRLEAQLDKLNDIVRQAVADRIRDGCDPAIARRMLAEAMTLQERAHRNTLWPFLKRPMSDQCFQETEARLQAAARHSQLQWTAVGGAPRGLSYMGSRERLRQVRTESNLSQLLAVCLTIGEDSHELQRPPLRPTSALTVAYNLPDSKRGYSLILGLPSRVVPGP